MAHTGGARRELQKGQTHTRRRSAPKHSGGDERVHPPSPPGAGYAPAPHSVRRWCSNALCPPCCAPARPPPTVVPHNFSEQDMYKLLFASLQHLDRVSAEVFDKIKGRVSAPAPARGVPWTGGGRIPRFFRAGNL